MSPCLQLCSLTVLLSLPVCAGECSERQFYVAGAYFDAAAKLASAEFSKPRHHEMGVLYSCHYDLWLGLYSVKGRYSFEDIVGETYWMDLSASFTGNGGNVSYGPADEANGTGVRLARMLELVLSTLFVLGQPRVLKKPVAV